jgi:hypothetical protein
MPRPRGGLQAARRALMSQSEKSFTVSDRRHFTPEGRPREEGQEEDRRPSSSASDGAQGEDAPAQLSHFLLGLAAEAGRLMSGEGLPEGTPRETALAGARSIVAILEMLRDKTEGRRTPEEDALLADLLFQLRMAYVECTRPGQA